MKRLLRWLIQIDAHSLVGIFSLICAIVGVMAALQHSDQKSNELWAKDGGTAVAAKDSYGTR
ncbi:hypothetical protein BN2877_57630 [Achromobacter xylosoxidans]|nr:hypothetical protein BN2877_57630 [Achromobacter xylosoxidans]